jgi:hypothetical protein
VSTNQAEPATYPEQAGAVLDRHIAGIDTSDRPPLRSAPTDPTTQGDRK